MKCWISTREHWPDFDLFKNKQNYYEGAIELTDSEWEEWQSAKDTFNAWQSRIFDAHKASRK